MLTEETAQVAGLDALDALDLSRLWSGHWMTPPYRPVQEDPRIILRFVGQHVDLLGDDAPLQFDMFLIDKRVHDHVR